jgi:hypothetical protein
MLFKRHNLHLRYRTSMIMAQWLYRIITLTLICLDKGYSEGLRHTLTTREPLTWRGYLYVTVFTSILPALNAISPTPSSAHRTAYATGLSGLAFVLLIQVLMGAVLPLCVTFWFEGSIKRCWLTSNGHHTRSRPNIFSKAAWLFVWLAFCCVLVEHIVGKELYPPDMCSAAGQ